MTAITENRRQQSQDIASDRILRDAPEQDAHPPPPPPSRRCPMPATPGRPAARASTSTTQAVTGPPSPRTLPAPSTPSSCPTSTCQRYAPKYHIVWASNHSQAAVAMGREVNSCFVLRQEELTTRHFRSCTRSTTSGARMVTRWIVLKWEKTGRASSFDIREAFCR